MHHHLQHPGKLLSRRRAKLPKRWKFAMKLRLISLTPFPLSLSLKPLSFPFISGDAGVFIRTRNERVIDRGIEFNRSTLPFPLLSLLLLCWTLCRSNILCVKFALTMKNEPDEERASERRRQKRRNETLHKSSPAKKMLDETREERGRRLCFWERESSGNEARNIQPNLILLASFTKTEQILLLTYTIFNSSIFKSQAQNKCFGCNPIGKNSSANSCCKGFPLLGRGRSSM